MRYGPLTPYNWPQNELQIPNGFGIMPRVDDANKMFSRQEWAVYGTKFSNFDQGSQQEIVIPIEADADFWITNIFVTCRTVNINQVNRDWGISAKMQVTDIRTGYQLFYPFTRSAQFAFYAMNFGTSSENFLAQPSMMVQPYCFTRNGGIKVYMDLLDLTDPINGGPVDYYINFNGWKEYTYASR